MPDAICKSCGLIILYRQSEGFKHLRCSDCGGRLAKLPYARCEACQVAPEAQCHKTWSNERGRCQAVAQVPRQPVHIEGCQMGASITTDSLRPLTRESRALIVMGVRQ